MIRRSVFYIATALALTSECRLESININVNRTFGNQQPEGFNANGNFTFHIKLK